MRLRAASIPLAIVLLAGCASHSGGDAGRRTAALTVHVGVFGGPMLPNGHMAASNSPDTGASIVVTGQDGRTHRAETDAHGVASFALDPGRYTVNAPCGRGPQSVTVRSGQSAHVEIQCDVP